MRRILKENIAVTPQSQSLHTGDLNTFPGVIRKAFRSLANITGCDRQLANHPGVSALREEAAVLLDRLLRSYPWEDLPTSTLTNIQDLQKSFDDLSHSNSREIREKRNLNTEIFSFPKDQELLAFMQWVEDECGVGAVITVAFSDPINFREPHLKINIDLPLDSKDKITLRIVEFWSSKAQAAPFRLLLRDSSNFCKNLGYPSHTYFRPHEDLTTQIEAWWDVPNRNKLAQACTELFQLLRDYSNTLRSGAALTEEQIMQIQKAIRDCSDTTTSCWDDEF